MKTIKFKGLRLDGKGWVYGDFINSLEYGAMIMLTAHCGGNSFDEAPSDYQDSVQVIPESVGQFTGLQDKNGVDIYEGDNIRVCDNKNGLLTVVFVNEYVGGWVLIHESTKNKLSLGARKSNTIEVIGNINEK